jgi:hypothetical protein
MTVYEVGQQGAMNGPFLCSSKACSEQQLQLQEASKLPQMGYSHMVYVCYKP